MVVSRLAFFREILVRGFPPPYRGTGHAFDRGKDEFGGPEWRERGMDGLNGALGRRVGASRIGVDMFP